MRHLRRLMWLVIALLAVNAVMRLPLLLNPRTRSAFGPHPNVSWPNGPLMQTSWTYRGAEFAFGVDFRDGQASRIYLCRNGAVAKLPLSLDGYCSLAWRGPDAGFMGVRRATDTRREIVLISPAGAITSLGEGDYTFARPAPPSQLVVLGALNAGKDELWALDLRKRDRARIAGLPAGNVCSCCADGMGCSYLLVTPKKPDDATRVMLVNPGERTVREVWRMAGTDVCVTRVEPFFVAGSHRAFVLWTSSERPIEAPAECGTLDADGGSYTQTWAGRCVDATSSSDGAKLVLLQVKVGSASQPSPQGGAATNDASDDTAGVFTLTAMDVATRAETVVASGRYRQVQLVSIRDNVVSYLTQGYGVVQVRQARLDGTDDHQVWSTASSTTDGAQ